MLTLPYHLVLGSQSPRRAELIKGLDIPFEVLYPITKKNILKIFLLSRYLCT